ncbi:MAG: helix-turn-helix transcriptional regulator [Erysipelotrichaceae bacterium]|nr:helix-turn-helix transcriptional regulator [Erysipelotrichaceae bacterium]
MLSENIQILRESRNLTQVQFAAKLNVKKQTISNWENGYVMPSVQQLVNIALIFSASTDHLTGLDKRRIIDVTDFSDNEVAHIQQLVDDYRALKSIKK